MWWNSKLRCSTKILKYFTLGTQFFLFFSALYLWVFPPNTTMFEAWVGHNERTTFPIASEVHMTVFSEPPNYVYFEIIPIRFGTSEHNIFVRHFRALLSLLQQSIFIGLLLPRKFILYLQDRLLVCLLDGVLHHLSAPRPNISSLPSGRQIRQFAAAVMLRGSGGGGGRRTTHLGIPAKKWGFSIEATVWTTKHFEI